MKPKPPPPPPKKKTTASKAKPRPRSGLSPLAGSRPRTAHAAPPPREEPRRAEGEAEEDEEKVTPREQQVPEPASRSSSRRTPSSSSRRKPIAREARSPAAPDVIAKVTTTRRTAAIENAPTATFLPGTDDDLPRPKPARSKPEPTAKDDAASLSMAPAVVAQIRELEAQLDRLIDEASRRDVSSLVDDDDDDDDDDGSDLEITRDALPEMMAEVAARRPTSHHDVDELAAEDEAARAMPAMPPAPRSERGLWGRVGDRGSSPSIGQQQQQGEATVFDTARELLSSDFYLRKWGRLAMRGRSEEVDDFGFDPIYEQKARTVLEFLYTRYFRVDTTGIDRVPSRGRCLLVANHSGTLPLDGVMLKTAVKLEHASPRDVRWLTEDFIYHMPYLGSTMNRLGAVRACQENAERLLAKEQLVAVFPEGVKGIGKLFSERYRLQRFGRGGFIKLCLRTNTPIVPVAVVGAEETNPLLFRIEYLSKALGLPYVPVTPTFPALGPLGLLPAPTKWQIHFGEPIDFGGHGRDAADDELLVGKLAERVRATIQGMLDRAVGSRKSVFFG
jgi:1-acyl-sn-glycerol-3-phosphate acyltransferase